MIKDIFIFIYKKINKKLNKMDNKEIQKLFTKVTGITWDITKLSDEARKKLLVKWLIPDGSMLEVNNQKSKDIIQLLEAFGLNKNEKIDLSFDDSESEEDIDSLIEEILSTAVKPEVIENTQEQEETSNSILESIENGEKTIVLEEGKVLNNITIPSENIQNISITGEINDGATITNNSTKSLSVINTGEPVNVTFDMKGEETNGTVSIKGKYNDIYTDSTLSATSMLNAVYANVNGDITIDENVNKALSVSVSFTDDEENKEHNVITNSDLGGKVLTVSNLVSNGEETTEPNLNVVAPNASVKLGGKYDEVSVICSDNTLTFNLTNFHAKKLILKKGRVYFEFVEEMLNEFIDILEICDGATVEYASTHATSSNLKGITSIFSGSVIVDEDITLTNKSMAVGVTSSAKEKLDLNGHTIQMGTSSNGMFLIRGKAALNIIDNSGNGKLINNSNSYCIFNSDNNALTNIYGGNFEAYTHVIYCYNGTVNIYGGTFKLLGNGEVDSEGLFKFLLNCYDSNYSNGTAKINVYGGKFYNFNPAVSYGEPNSPVSFVADGYKVIETEEDGVKVFEVVKK